MQRLRRVPLLICAFCASCGIKLTGHEVMHISGHTVLLSYLLVSSRSTIVRVASILVLGQTFFLKYYLWHDFVTSNVGLVLGCALALIVESVSRRLHHDEMVTRS
jgi:hypothetical protein